MTTRHPIRTGALLWPQATDWPALRAAALAAETAGLDSLWTWDHLHAIVGDPDQPIFEGWLMLTAWATLTTKPALGLMGGANTFRNPGHTAKLAVTLDHISGGRAWLGIGGAWFEHEHQRHGIDFGSGFGQRLDWLEEAVAAAEGLFRGEEITSPEGGHYHFDRLVHHPLPVRGAGTLPVMIGGGGERKTLRTVARHAQGWNVFGPPEELAHKRDVLARHCDDAGRDMAEIEFTINPFLVLRDTAAEAETVLRAALAANDETFEPMGHDFLGSEEQVAELWRPYLDLGFTHLIGDLPAPVDLETLERLPHLRALVAGR